MSDLAPEASIRRLLFLIDASDRSRQLLDHALALQSAGQALEVVLLYVIEPVRCWEVLKFRSEAEVAQHFAERAGIFLQLAAARLQAAGIPCRGYCRTGDPATLLRALAEEQQCTALVIPRQTCLGLPLGLQRRLQRQPGTVPVLAL